MQTLQGIRSLSPHSKSGRVAAYHAAPALQPIGGTQHRIATPVQHVRVHHGGAYVGIDPSTKVVVLTGYGSVATAIEAIRLGATYYGMGLPHATSLGKMGRGFWIDCSLVVLLLLTSRPVWGTAGERALAAEQEATARRVEEQLMAPCCFGSTVATHYSPAADAIRRDVRALVARGASEPEILAVYFDRYGERILAQPVAWGFNLLAYATPVGAWLCGTLALVRWCRRRRHGMAPSSTASAPSGPNAERWLEQMDRDLAALDT